MSKLRIGGLVAGAALVAAVQVVATGVGTSQATTAATGWREAPVPRIEGENFLSDVAVFGKKDAWAVGRAFAADQTVILRSDGATWARVPGPGRDSFAGTAVRDLGLRRLGGRPVCVRAGDLRDPCAAHWDGAEWSRPYSLPQPSMTITTA